MLGRKKQALTTEMIQEDRQMDNMLMMVENYQKRRSMISLESENQNTVTLRDQARVEAKIHEFYAAATAEEAEFPQINTASHLKYLERALMMSFPPSYVSLDASKLWIVYWIVNSAVLLGAKLDLVEKKAIADKVEDAVSSHGGIGGGVGQIGHIACCYSGLMASVYGTKLNIDTAKIYQWIMADLKQIDGSFRMHRNGEADTRAVYCALCTASALQVMSPELAHNVARWISSCQTFEGGFGGTPYTEAHGGYTFCAVASLCMLGDPLTMLNKYCNFEKLLSWAEARQCATEGGFQGRSNKLVDACYSQWVGGIFPFLEAAVGGNVSLFNREGLENYLIGCCQDPKGGFRDKPGKGRDFYHTNYSLIGLSHAQHSYSFDMEKYLRLKKKGLANAAAFCYKVERRGGGDSGGEVCAVNPVFGVAQSVVEKAEWYER